MSSNGRYEAEASYDVEDLLRLDIPEPEFYVDRFIPKRSVIVFAGESGVGKSHILLSAIFAMLSEEKAFGCLDTEITKVQLFTEDEEEVIGPYIRRVSSNFPQGNYRDFQVNIGVDTFHRLEAKVEAFKPGLVIIDPLATFSDLKNTNTEEGVMPVIKRLKALSRRSNASILFTRHVAKSTTDKTYTDANIFERIIGSQQFRAATSHRIVVWRKGYGDYRLSMQSKFMSEWHVPITIDAANGVIEINEKLDTDSPARISKYREPILKFLAEKSPQSYGPAALSKCLSVFKYYNGTTSTNAVTKELIKLAAKGLVVNTSGKYKYASGIGEVIESIPAPRINPRYATPLETNAEDEAEENEEDELEEVEV